MSLKTLEVSIENGAVVPANGETLPETGRAILTILEPAVQQAKQPGLIDVLMSCPYKEEMEALDLSRNDDDDMIREIDLG